MVLTRSAAKRANPSRDRPEPQDASNAFSPGATTSTIQQQSKRVKVRKNASQTQGASKRQYIRGKLAMLPEMNLDVLSQILSYLLPMDLLNLARLTRSFRQFLMSKARAFVWVAARKQIDGLPDCPPDMSEPEYANLIFDPHCHSCGGVVYTIYWRIRRRYCPACRKTRLSEVNRCDPVGMLPIERLESIVGICDNRFVDKHEHDAVHKQYLNTPIGETDTFMAQRRQIAADREEQASKLSHWHQVNVVYVRNEELKNARALRQESIFARLQSAGYGREIEHFGTNHIIGCQSDVFRTSKRLTEKEWERVYSKLQPKMVELREERLEKKVWDPRRKLLMKVYNRYVSDPAPEGEAVDLLPSVRDVVGFAPFHSVINLPEDEAVEEATFVPSLEQLPTLTKQWREKVDAEMASLISTDTAPSTSARGKKGTDASPMERLQLACAVFEVKNFGRCGEVFTYPRILGESLVFYDYRSAHPWSLSKNVHLFSGAADVIAGCGLDPRVATVDDVDQANARLTCNACRKRSPDKVKIFNWKSAILHAHRLHRNQVRGERWTLVDKNLIPAIVAEEQFCTPPTRAPTGKSPVYCVLCQPYANRTRYDLVQDNASRSPRSQMSDHLKDAHGIQGPPQEDVHYAVPRGCFTRRPRPVLMITEGGTVSFSHE